MLYIHLFLTNLIWGLNVIVTKLNYDSFHPLFLAMLKIIFSVLALLFYIYYKKISLRELAENKYFVNYSYCSRLFSQETGMNFSKYLIQYRLKKAKTLLENKDMKISFIAFEVGYNDVSHFIQSFKKSYGLTPEEYRARKKIE